MPARESTKTRRGLDRNKPEGPAVFRICRDEETGRARWLTADVVDHTESGIGLSLAAPLTPGIRVTARGRINGHTTAVKARVAWCLERPDGTYRAGLEYEGPKVDDPFNGWKTESAGPADDPQDYYEVLQLSANADPDTLHRVYRMLAQRYHPDNTESGDETTFKQILHAYQVLADPERRAAYDAGRQARRQARWRIFDQRQAAVGAEAEKRKREGMLALLYTQRISEPEHPDLSIHDMEDLLGWPRDHLQVSLWCLRESGLITRSDNGRYAITVKGFLDTETAGTWLPDKNRLLAGPAPQVG